MEGKRVAKEASEGAGRNTPDQKGLWLSTSCISAQSQREKL